MSRVGAAVTHPLNLFLVAGAAASAFLTGSWIPLAVFGGVELAWVAIGPYLGGQRRYYEALAKAAAKSDETRGEQKQLASVSEADRRRFLELDRLRTDIERLSNDNPSLSMELMRGELDKVQHLVDKFLEMASEAARLDSFLESTDLDELEADVRRQEKIVEKTADADAKRLAAQNLEVMQARLERAAEMKRRVRHTRGQLSLIENTMALLRDQVATIDAPQEISGRLDELVDSVDAIEATSKELDGIARPNAQRLIG